MKSQVNLYHQEFHPCFELYSSKNLVMISAFFVALSLSLFTFVEFSKASAEDELAASRAELANTEAQIDQMLQDLASRTSDPVLAAKLSKARSNMQTQRDLVAEIRSLSRLKNKSFSGLFDAFSSNSKQNLWLTSFTVNETDLTIQGELSVPRALPTWLEGLSDSAYFDGQEFNNAVVERHDEVLFFQLTSQAKSSAGLGSASNVRN